MFILKVYLLKIAILFLRKRRKKNISPCDVINTSLHVMPNGDVKPCMFMESLGNLKDKKINEILNDKNTYLVKEQIKKNNCPKCWMNCYSPHSIMQHPLKSLIKSFVK